MGSLPDPLPNPIRSDTDVNAQQPAEDDQVFVNYIASTNQQDHPASMPPQSSDKVSIPVGSIPLLYDEDEVVTTRADNEFAETNTIIDIDDVPQLQTSPTPPPVVDTPQSASSQRHRHSATSSSEQGQAANDYPPCDCCGGESIQHTLRWNGHAIITRLCHPKHPIIAAAEEVIRRAAQQALTAGERKPDATHCDTLFLGVCLICAYIIFSKPQAPSSNSATSPSRVRPSDLQSQGKHTCNIKSDKALLGRWYVPAEALSALRMEEHLSLLLQYARKNATEREQRLEHDFVPKGVKRAVDEARTRRTQLNYAAASPAHRQGKQSQHMAGHQAAPTEPYAAALSHVAAQGLQDEAASTQLDAAAEQSQVDNPQHNTVVWNNKAAEERLEASWAALTLNDLDAPRLQPALDTMIVPFVDAAPYFDATQPGASHSVEIGVASAEQIHAQPTPPRESVQQADFCNYEVYTSARSPIALADDTSVNARQRRGHASAPFDRPVTDRFTAVHSPFNGAAPQQIAYVVQNGSLYHGSKQCSRLTTRAEEISFRLHSPSARTILPPAIQIDEVSLSDVLGRHKCDQPGCWPVETNLYKSPRHNKWAKLEAVSTAKSGGASAARVSSSNDRTLNTSCWRRPQR